MQNTHSSVYQQTIPNHLFFFVALFSSALVLTLMTGCQDGTRGKNGPSPRQPVAENNKVFQVVMFKDEPGYELHMPRDSAEQLRYFVNNDFVMDKIKRLLEAGISTNSQAAGFDAQTADVFAQLIGKLFKANAEKFKQELASNMGSEGIILTIKPNKPWVLKTSGEIGLKFDIADPVGNTFQNNRALINWIVTQSGGRETVEASEKLRTKFRELTWASETPPTVLINSAEWSIGPRD